MSEIKFQFPEEVPLTALQVIHADVIPRFVSWAKGEQLSFEEISSLSIQRHENGTDWMLKVHLLDGRCQPFPVVVGKVH